MLRKIRTALALVFFIGITLLFIGIGEQWWSWMAKLQFLPSCLALNFAVIAGIILLSLVFGRVYCSVICPLGVYQDDLIWLRRQCGKFAAKLFKKKPRKNFLLRFHFVKEHKIVRYLILLLTIVCIVAGAQIFVALIAPYSTYGRMVRSAVGAIKGESIATPLLLSAGTAFLLITFLAVTRGREWCNTICPVGTFLSLLSRFSFFRPTIDESKCVSCGKCASGCKTSCIDVKAKKIDGSRCICCFDCLESCARGAIKYRTTYGKPQSKSKEKSVQDNGRRNFLATGAALIGAGIAAEAQNKRLDGGLADIVEKQTPERSERIVPFGAKSVRDFYDKCTACQLCVANCPNGVLRPSTDLKHLLQPQMGYERGYCRPECTTCSNVCPAGAISPVSKDEKTTIRIGTAKVNLQLCLAANGEAGCGNCSRHCPSGAIRMLESEGHKFRIPTVAEEQCIGCGACEYLCPVRPISAITVSGLSVHIPKN